MALVKISDLSGDSIVFCGPERNSNKKVQLEALGVQVIEVSASHEVGLSIENVLKKCAALGIQDILVEGGPTLLGSFVRDDLYDQIYLFMSPKIIGANGRSIFEGFNIPKLQNAAQLTNTSISLLGDDIVWRGERICSQA
jgi:diaminohydroxyphosphoribosylaminopyrimidine deaminase/5-amino-6-(5-phosphoribosylamino)uracil reductase